MHGEFGQTQFMPKSILQYGTGNLDSPSGALTSTANFLKAHGWRAGAGYQPGQPNFAAIQEWNAASVYQQAIALMGRQIDGEGLRSADAADVRYRAPGGRRLSSRRLRESNREIVD